MKKNEVKNLQEKRMMSSCHRFFIFNDYSSKFDSPVYNVLRLFLKSQSKRIVSLIMFKNKKHIF